MSGLGGRAIKILGLGGLAIGASLIGWQLARINQVLGCELLDASQRMLQQQQRQVFKQQIKQDGLGYLKIKAGFKMELLEERFTVYYNRLLLFRDYQQINNTLIREVVNPILANYDKEEVFDNAKVIQFLQNQGNFNNPVTSLLINVQQNNKKLKEEKQGYIQDLIEIQNKLMTIRFLGLSQTQKQAIDLLYNYLNAKDLSLFRLAQRDLKVEKQQTSIKTQDYLSKIQQL